MTDESSPRVRAECAHAWEIVNSVERRCQKCLVLWETWAEEHMRALEARITTLEELLSGDDEELDVAVITLLPPQTEYTCPTCNGTGQTALGEYAVICSLCAVPYEIAYVESLDENSVLRCGHAATALVGVTACLDCGGTGTRQAC